MTQQKPRIFFPASNSLKSDPQGFYPCLCLCFGFSQMILTAPLRLMTLHFSQIGLTDALTFTIFSPFQNVRQLLYHFFILKASTNPLKKEKLPRILR